MGDLNPPVSSLSESVVSAGDADCFSSIYELLAGRHALKQEVKLAVCSALFGIHHILVVLIC